uniref:dihydropyrimidinase n=1 Tax=Parastrongyloides trichosuri TaxID=131310 RepID=A0A0N4ZB63_PARTI
MSSSSILIRNGTVVNEDFIQKADVLIKNGIIIAVEQNIEKVDEDVEVIDATDRLIIPGGIDPHTHMQMPFMGQVAVDDFYTGTRAAVAGGTTMIIDFVAPSKNNSLIEAYHLWRSWADPKVVCDYGLSMCVTWWSDKVAEEMTKLVTPEYGINSFKFFLAYKHALMVDDGEFYQGLQHCSKIRALARVHAENGHIIEEKQKELLACGVRGPEGHTQSRPEEIEAEAVNRACCLADQANCPLYVVHVMSKGAADEIAKARMNGQVVFGEPIAAGLALDGRIYYDKDWETAARYIMSPPLSRKEETKFELMKMLARIISATTHHHNLDTNVYEGMEVHGVPEITISRGVVVWRDGKLYIEKGSGRFIPLSPDCDYVFGTINKKTEAKKPISVQRDI